MQTRLLLSFAVLATATFSFSQKKPLDAATYETWRTLRGISFANDGKWVLYTLALQDGDPVVEVKETNGTRTYTIERGSNVQFSEDGKFVLATILPKSEEVKKLRRAKAKPDDMPKNAFLILNLESGQRTEMEKVSSFTLATHDSGWLAYKPEPPKPAPPAKPAETPKPAEGQKPEGQKPAEPKKKADHKAGDPLVLRNLATGKEERLENVVTSRWTKDGKVFVYTVSTPDGAGDGIVWYQPSTGERKQIVTGMGKYPKVAVADSGKAVAFVTDKDDYAAKKPASSLYVWRDGKLKQIKPDGLKTGFVIAEAGSLSFSEKGTRLTFATAAKAEEEKKDDTPEDEKVSVDIWNWQDRQLMSQQLLRVAQDRSRTFDALYDLGQDKVIALETPEYPNSTVSEKGDGQWAMLTSILPYERENGWGEGRTDYMLVNLRNGATTELAKGFNGSLTFSPSGRFAVGYSDDRKELFSIQLSNGKRAILNSNLPPIWDEEDDHPSSPGFNGFGGFTADDRGLVYDRYDVWLVSLDGSKSPVNLTAEAGRRSETAYRLLRLDPEQDFVDLSKPIMLAAFNTRTKDAGYAKLGGGNLQTLLMAPKAFSASVQSSPMPTLVKARDAEVYAYQRMDVDEPADAWLSGADFKSPRKLSDLNPQQKEYNWLSAELVSWTSNDGAPLQGVLYKPENFDATKRYPMITYFYERNSDTLHQYYSPAPSASTINISMYCSNGYLVFVPDIPYKVGYPGESAVSAILPGVQSLLTRGYIDPKKLGIQGQSWGGYQVGYLVTETNMFAAACAGAPVSNMVSAYGGIRWESGVSRAGQYEVGQSRIGGNLWQNPLRYIENSPIFFADKVKTPLLIMSNDKDGAVPWYQGIEYFTALRRLNKPSWLVVYNDEAHNLMQRKNRKDWSIRMQQFFDHYLKGAPMPLWMSQGVPATQKGKSYGFEVPSTTKTGGK